MTVPSPMLRAMAAAATVRTSTSPNPWVGCCLTTVDGHQYLGATEPPGGRHAERVALAMDARAFGAHRDRTERYLLPWRARDTVFMLVFWAVSAVVLTALFPWGM